MSGVTRLPQILLAFLPLDWIDVLVPLGCLYVFFGGFFAYIWARINRPHVKRFHHLLIGAAVVVVVWPIGVINTLVDAYRARQRRLDSELRRINKGVL